MKKIVFLFFSIILFIFGCSYDESEDGYDFQGISISSHYGWDTLTIFVEDNYGGFDVVDDYFNVNIDLEHYWVEAYRVAITENTKIINEATGDEGTVIRGDNYVDMLEKNINIFTHLYEYKRRMAIKVEESFEKTILENRNGYILTNNEFLPIYTAKEIRILPYTYEQLMDYNQSNPGTYTVMGVYEEITDDPDTGGYYFEISDVLNEMNEQLNETNEFFELYVHFFPFTKEEIMQYPLPVELNTFPVYLIVDSEDKMTIAETREELIEFFEEVFNVQFGLE